MAQTSPEFLRKMIAHYEKQAAGLIKDYGTGVRPSWVSCELALAEYRAKEYKDLLDELEAKQ